MKVYIARPSVRSFAAENQISHIFTAPWIFISISLTSGLAWKIPRWICKSAHIDNVYCCDISTLVRLGKLCCALGLWTWSWRNNDSKICVKAWLSWGAGCEIAFWEAIQDCGSRNWNFRSEVSAVVSTSFQIKKKPDSVAPGVQWGCKMLDSPFLGVDIICRHNEGAFHLIRRRNHTLLKFKVLLLGLRDLGSCFFSQALPTLHLYLVSLEELGFCLSVRVLGHCQFFLGFEQMTFPICGIVCGVKGIFMGFRSIRTQLGDQPIRYRF